MKVSAALIGLLSIGSIVTTATVLTSSPAPSPELTPRRVLLTWSGDPSRTASVTWRTDAVPAKVVAEISKASADPRFTRNATTFNGSPRPTTIEGKTVAYPRVNFSGLTPDTRYSYRVGDGTNWSEWFDFKTASAEPKPFRFVYFGDAQNDIKSMWSRVIRQASKDAPYADFFLHAGDLVNRPNSDDEWEDWFYAGGWLHSTIPSIATPGNHEYTRGTLSEQWRPHFAFPKNGVSGLEDSNYYIDFQGARIVSLNSLEKQAEQVEWLDNILANNPQKWTFLTFHYPMWSTAQGRDNKQLREAWLPVILKHNVDLIMQGHDHSYGRRNVPTGTSGQKGNTVFVVSVSGPKMYSVGDSAKANMDKTAENTQLYQIVSVDGDVLKYEALTAVGDLYDSFELRKQPDGSSKLVK